MADDFNIINKSIHIFHILYKKNYCTKSTKFRWIRGYRKNLFSPIDLQNEYIR